MQRRHPAAALRPCSRRLVTIPCISPYPPSPAGTFPMQSERFYQALKVGGWGGYDCDKHG